MTTLQKITVTAALAITVGAGIYEAKQAANARAEVQALQQAQAPLAEQMQQLQKERDEATNRLAGLLAENSRLNSNPNQSELLKLRGEVTQLRIANLNKKNDPVEAEALQMASRINQVKQWLEHNPQEEIPELVFAGFSSWVNHIHALGDWKGSTNDFNFISGQMRTSGKQIFCSLMNHALGNFLIEHNGQLPSDISELKPYLSARANAANSQGYKVPEISDAMLQRYQLVHDGNVKNFPEQELFIAEKTPNQTAQYDALFKIGVFGYSYQSLGPLGASGSGGDVPADMEQKLKELYVK